MSSLKYVSLTILAYCMLMAASFAAHGAIIEDLYDARVMVSDQTDSSQAKAIKQALRQVLVKVSGADDLLSNNQIQKTLNKAATLIRSYTYEREQGQLYLLVSFDQDKVQNAIRNAGFAVWDKRRPDTIVWLAIETSEQNKQVLNHETSPLLAEKIQQQATLRGIKVVMPLWDLTDLELVDVYAIWGGFIQQISLASERYEMNSILSARIYPQPPEDGQAASGRWLADWLLLDNGQLLNGQMQANGKEQTVTELINLLSSQLAGKYAVSQQNRLLNPAKTRIVINNIDSISRYAEVLKFLNGLTVVASATLESQQGTKSTFALDLLGEQQDLLNTFSLDNKIRPANEGNIAAEQTLEFSWAN